MTTLTSSKLFTNLADGDLNFTNISVNETDMFSGTSGVTSFTTNSGAPADYLAGALTGMSWSGVALEAFADATGDPSSQTLSFSYNVSVSDSGEFITAIDSSYAIDLLLGDGQLVAVESIYDTHGNLLGTQSYSSAAAAPAPTQLSMGVQNAVVSLQLTLTASSPNADIEASIISQAFGQTAASALASLGNYVWLDSNGNGLQDSGETGVSGVTVDLLNATGTSVIAATTTNASGFYQFTGLLPGTYEVHFVAPTGDGFTTQGAGTNPAINSSASLTTGTTAPVTLTAGETDNDIDAGLVSLAPPLTAGLGDYVWFDSNANGLQDSGEVGVGGVTVDLLNATGSSILATTTTNGSGGYYFSGLAAGTYEVKFVAPTSDKYTVAGAGLNPAINSSANATTGVTAPVTLTAGQINNNVDAGLVASTSGTTPTFGITVNKIPGSMVINACGQETYTIAVTNNGSSAVTNLVLKDNIGTAAKPDYVTPTLVTPGFNGSLAAGATVDYSVTINQIADRSSGCGTVSHTCSGGNLGAGNTAWFSCSFTPTSTANGTCYVFKGVQCQLSGGGSGSYTVGCPDAVVTFSSSCKQASTVYNASTNCWVTTLPANCNPGSVFLTGCPVTVPAGGNFNNATCSWSIADSGNNCGSSSVSWNASCQGYSSFNQNGLNGITNYNDIGVKVCDVSSAYGNGGSTDIGSGCGNTGYAGWNFGAYGGWGNYNSNAWLGSENDCAGTPENQYTSGSCGSSGSNFNGGYGGGGYGNNCGGATNGGGCGNSGSGSCAQTQVGASGVADTVTVTGTTGGTTVTASDTAEIIVLGSPNAVSVNGTSPTGSLTTLYGKAQTLEFTYNPGNTVATKTVSIGASTGSNSNAMAFIAISNNANPNAPGAQIYFEGTVASGQKLYADAAINSLTNAANSGSAAYMSTVAGHGIVADIYTSRAAFLAGAAPVQVDTYNSSGSQTMQLNDKIGGLTLVGYVGATGGHVTS
jgi:hypothetical protein